MTPVQRQICVKICQIVMKTFQKINLQDLQINHKDDKLIYFIIIKQCMIKRNQCEQRGFDMVIESEEQDPMVCYAYDYKMEIYQKFKEYAKEQELPDEKTQKRSNKIVQVNISPNIQSSDLKVKINKAFLKSKKDKSNKIEAVIEGKPEMLQKAKNTLLAFQQITASFQMIPQGPPRAVITDEYRKDKEEEIDLEQIFDEEKQSKQEQKRGTLIIRQNFKIQAGQQTGTKNKEIEDMELDLEMMKKVDAFLKKKRDINQKLHGGVEIYDNFYMKKGPKSQNYTFNDLLDQMTYSTHRDTLAERYDPYQGTIEGDLELAKFRVRNYEQRDISDAIAIMSEIKFESEGEDKRKKEKQQQRPTKESKEEDRKNAIKYKPTKLSQSFQKGKRQMSQKVLDETEKEDLLQYFDKNGKVYKDMVQYFKNNNIQLNNKNIQDYIYIQSSRTAEDLLMLEKKLNEDAI